jgi:hypothetical protein
MAERSENLYGSDPQGAADAIETKRSVPTPTLDVHGESDSRAVSEGNHGKQG